MNYVENRQTSGAIPAGVTVKVDDHNVVTVKGPKGELTQHIHNDMKIEIEGATLRVSRPSDDKMHRSLHGLSRTLINNMIIGVTQGYQKALDVVGVGYRAQMQGKNLVLTSVTRIRSKWFPWTASLSSARPPTRSSSRGSTSSSSAPLQPMSVLSASPNPTMARASCMKPKSSAAREGKTGKK